MSPYKKAIDAWTETADWKSSSEPRTLRAPSEYRIYLESRLREAFSAGWSAHEASTSLGKPDEQS